MFPNFYFFVLMAWSLRCPRCSLRGWDRDKGGRLFVWNVPPNCKGRLWFYLQRGKRLQWICGKCYWQAAILGFAHGCQTHDVELQCLAPNSAVILFVLVSVMQSSHCPAWFSEVDVKMLPATPHSVCPDLSEHYWPTWPSMSKLQYI